MFTLSLFLLSPIAAICTAALLLLCEKYIKAM